jgi:hypothetical protein
VGMLPRRRGDEEQFGRAAFAAMVVAVHVGRRTSR